MTVHYRFSWTCPHCGLENIAREDYQRGAWRDIFTCEDEDDYGCGAQVVVKFAPRIAVDVAVSKIEGEAPSPEVVERIKAERAQAKKAQEHDQ